MTLEISGDVTIAESSKSFLFLVTKLLKDSSCTSTLTTFVGNFFTEFKFRLSSKSGCPGVAVTAVELVSATDKVTSENKGEKYRSNSVLDVDLKYKSTPIIGRTIQAITDILG